MATVTLKNTLLPDEPTFEVSREVLEVETTIPIGETDEFEVLLLDLEWKGLQWW